MYIRTKLFQKRGHYSREDMIQGGHYLRKYGKYWKYLDFAINNLKCDTKTLVAHHSGRICSKYVIKMIKK